MSSSVLNAKTRTETGKNACRRARAAGMIPGVVYGVGRDSASISVNTVEWANMRKHDISIIELKIDGGKIIHALLKEEQYDYLTSSYKHLDFFAVQMDKAISAHVTIHTQGSPVGLGKGGILDQFMHEIEVSCLPKDLPDSINIDISGLDLEQSLSVKDIDLPAGVEAVTDGELTVFSVALPAADTASGAEADDEAAGAEGGGEGGSED